MCGIVGGIWNKNATEQTLATALHEMRNRGPDDSGVFLHRQGERATILGHARLSIIDLSAAGHQPMQTLDGQLTIVYNGEIYNYIELRRDLERIGYSFVTQTDTEVLLACWAEWGASALQRLQGMFAFAVHDKLSNTLTIVRDAFGIKPLYYALTNEGIRFASTIGAIQAILPAKPKLNWQRAYDYLAGGSYDDAPATMYEGIYNILPGHLLHYTIGNPQQEPWLKLEIEEQEELNFSDAADLVRAHFLNSITLHLRSDVPLGTAVSGGIDSSAVVCAMRAKNPHDPIHTFSFIADDTHASEEYWVDVVNKHVNAVSHKIYARDTDIVADLDDLISVQGEPFISPSIYAQYCVYRCAREHGITVTLDGQGADELFAGYRGYPGHRIRSLLDKRSYISALTFALHWSRYPDRSLSHALQAATATMVSPRIYGMLSELRGNSMTPRWLNKSSFQDRGVAFGAHTPNQKESCHGRRLVSALRDSLQSRGLPALLRHGDRNSMRFSVESRVPFLTLNIAQLALSLPEKFLISAHGETKHVLREALKGIVPKEILDRKDKIGFAVPDSLWIGKRRESIRRILEQNARPEILDTSLIISLFDKWDPNKPRNSMPVWRWVNFLRWIHLSEL